jgi:DNA-binding winged helix-turn-helix (wHTH) protein
MAVSSSGKGVSFGSFLLSAENACLQRDGRAVALTPRAFDVLHYLAGHPQRLITKDDLLNNVWADTLVSDASIKVCIREIRKALGDDAKTPTYIETVHRRGYRFIAPVAGARDNGTAAVIAPPAFEHAAPMPAPLPRHPFVGRESELRQLRQGFAFASSGRRQCVVISGELGSGKTSLTETFANSLTDSNDSVPLVLYGHCFEQFGGGEPYMPVWEALGRAARQTGSAQVASLMSRHAAAHVGATSPASADPADPPSSPIAPRSDRLLREMSDAIESTAARTPLVIVLEDVQWADHCTIDLISALAGRQAPAKLMLIVTYRPNEVAGKTDHPLPGVINRLLTSGRCRELALDDLDEAAVARFLELRFPGHAMPKELARRVHERTGGCPLFLIHLVEDLVDQGVIGQAGGEWRLAVRETSCDDEREPLGALALLDTHVPPDLRAMIESNVGRLDSCTRRLLEAAAVAGVDFSATAVAAAAEMDVVQAESACEDLVRRHRFLEQSGDDEWPDGAVGTRYRFAHALYHGVIYDRIPVARRARLHQILGLRIEAAWGARACEEAANLAIHFEAARDWPRAVKYLRQAAQAAGRQYAYPEAESYLRRALTAVERLPTPDRQDHELELLSALGVNLQVTRGFAAPEVEALFVRAHTLCVERRDRADLEKTFPVVWGIWLFRKVRSDLVDAAEMGRELFSLAGGDTALLLQAHQAMCVTDLCRGNPLGARQHMELAAAIYDPVRHRHNAERFGQDPGVATLAFGAVALWILGHPDEARQAMEQSVSLATRLGQPSSRALAMHFAAMLHQLGDDAELTAHWSQRGIELAEEEGFSFWRAGGMILRGWARARAAGESNKPEADAAVEEIRGGLEAWLATGSRTYHTYFLGVLADALQQTGRAVESQKPLDEALLATEALSEGLYEAELHRLKGRAIVLTSDDPSIPAGAQMNFVNATTVARLQNAQFFEERASADLTALYSRRVLHRTCTDVAARSGPGSLSPALPGDGTNPVAHRSSTLSRP